MQKLKRTLFVVALTCAFITSSSLAAKEPKEIFEQSHRPTVTQVKSIPEPRRFVSRWLSSHARQVIRQTLDEVEADGPRVIALLEAAFPGAVFAPLGRDASLLGDVLDAFYQSLGHNRRVRRLNASTDSFDGVDEATVVKFLETNGLVLTKYYKGPPFVIIDRTSYGTNSQSTILMRAGYRAYARKYGNAAALVQRFNLATTYSTDSYNSIDDVNDMLVAEKKNLAEKKTRVPQRILNIASRLTDGFEWHDPFGEMRERSNGKVYTVPGDLEGEVNRAAVIATIAGIIQLVSKPQFLKQVQEEADRLGYVFPLKQNYLSPLDRPSANLELLSKDFRRKIANLKVYVKDDGVEKPPRLSPNGQAIGEWIEESSYQLSFLNGPEVFELMLYGVATAFEKNKIGNRDFRHLVADVLILAKHDQDFAVAFATALHRNPKLKAVWNERRSYFADASPDRHGGDAVPKAYRYFSDKLRTSDACQAVFSTKF
jgi:hypothetical protein